MNFGLKRISDTEFEGVKSFDFVDLKVDSTSDGFFISGYVNTKNKPDSYGDIPANFNGKPVYDLTRYQKNPVLLVDHINSVGYIAGKAVDMTEDDKGLFVKFQLMENPVNPVVQHAIQAIKEGLANATSIGGRWFYENPDNQSQLTKASISEISLVGVGADPRALYKPAKKSIQGKGDKSEQVESLASMIGQFRATGNLEVLEEIKTTLKTK